MNKLELTDDGVDVVLDIDNGYDEIPADTLAVVGNRSAVGEQYVELQPQRDDGPYLHDGSVIDEQDTRLPIATDTLLTHLSETVESVDKDELKTTVDELGAAFGGTGEDLQRIIDTGNSFINTANDNFDVTTALIRDSNTVLHGQIDSESAIRNFSSQLQAFSTVLAGADPDLRHLIDTGGVAATQLRTFLEQNRVELGDLINNLVTTGEVDRQAPRRHQADPGDLPLRRRGRLHGGLEVAGHRPLRRPLRDDPHRPEGLPPGLRGHRHPAAPGRREPADERRRPLRRAGDREQRPWRPERARARPHRRTPTRPVVASYDPETGKLTWGDPARRPAASSTGTVAPPTLGEESWKWLFLQPLTTGQE